MNIKSGLTKSVYHNTYTFPPKFTLQFGGNGTDYLTDVQVLSTGDFVVAGSSTSSSLDGNANPNASSDFIAIIDKALPQSGFIKAIAWENATGGNRIRGRVNYPHVTIDGSDNIYHSYGTLSPAYSLVNTCVIKKRSSADLSVLATSAAFPDMAGNVDIQIWNSQVIFGCVHSKFDGRLVISRCNASDLTSAGADSAYGDSTVGYMTTPQIIGDKYYYGRGWPAGNYPYIARWDLATLVKESGDNAFMGTNNGPSDNYYKPSGCNDGSQMMYFLRYDNSKLRKGYFIGTVWQFVDEVSLTCNALGYFDPIYYDGNIYTVGSENKAGVVGTLDPYIFKINTTPAVVDQDFMKYADGTQLGQAGKTYTMGRRPAVYDTNKLVSVGATNGNLVGFSYSGTGTDCIILKTGIDGVVL